VLRSIASVYRRRARAKRAAIFLHHLNPSEHDRILDLGSGDGSHMASIIPYRENVWIADISVEALERGRKRFGFNTVVLKENGPLPFADGFFDIVFCSSVIEHVTVAKDELAATSSTATFRGAARQRQRAFAAEIVRVGKRYFVQTPNRYFLLESHTWLPIFVVFLPRRFLVRLIAFLNRWWVKKTSADWHLLTAKELQALFPDAKLLRERSFGLTKSLMAVEDRRL